MMNTGWKTGLLALLLLAGCGEISYKRGASGDDLAADQQGCRAARGDFDACMAARGWTTYRPGAMVIDDDASAPGGQLTADAAPAGNVKPGAHAEPGAQPLLLSAGTTKDNRGAMPEDALKLQPKTAARPFDPLAVHDVGSWWKHGGGREDLETSAAACGARLGEPHKLVVREGGGHRASALLIRCLKEYGWYGLGIP